MRQTGAAEGVRSRGDCATLGPTPRSLPPGAESTILIISSVIRRLQALGMALP